MSNESRPTQFFVRFRNAGVLAVLLVLVVGAAILTPQHTFIGAANLKLLSSQAPEFGIVALGVGVLMVAGEFDLSVGAVLTFCSFVFAWLLALPVNPFVAAGITLACGAAIGMINGLITVKAKVVSFIATLGAMLSYRGLVQILSGGKMRTVALDQEPVFVQLLTGRLGGIVPVQVLWFILFAVILFFVLNRGRLGNWIYATGDNAMAARAMAVDTDLVKIVCFVIVGSLVAFASVLQTVRVTTFNTHMATGWELQAVAAAVVGGTSLLGGRGSMVGVFLGAVIIMVIDNMIGQARLASEWTYMAFGLVLLAAALLDLAIEKRIQRAAVA